MSDHAHRPLHAFNQLVDPATGEPYPPPVPAAAVAIVNHRDEMLLVKRVRYGALHGNDWVYPGGMVESGEMIYETARREVLEETGLRLDPERNHLLPIANYITAPNAAGTRHDLLVYAARYHVDQPDPTVASPNEITDWGWFDPQAVLTAPPAERLNILPSGMYAIQRLHEYLSDDKTRVYGEVLMGGTFDRLHAGHRQLLTKAFEVGDYVYIGLTTDAYIARSNKQLKERIKPHADRLFALRLHLQQQGVLNRTIILPLDDTAGPKALDPKLGALILTDGTQKGGEYVNDLRRQNGVGLLDLITLPLVTDDMQQIISSTRLRLQEIAQSDQP